MFKLKFQNVILGALSAIGLIFIFILIADYVNKNVATEKSLRSIIEVVSVKVVSVEPEEVTPGAVSVITFITTTGLTAGSEKKVWLKGDRFGIRPNLSGGKILSIRRGQNPGYYIVHYQSPTNQFFTRSYPIEISIGLERYDEYEPHGRFSPLSDVATVTVLNPEFTEPIDISLKRTGGLQYTGGGSSLYKETCEKTEDCKQMYNFVPWNTKDGEAVKEEDAVQLECAASRCVLPSVYRTIGIWCNNIIQCDTGGMVKVNKGIEYRPELICAVSDQYCVGGLGVNCVKFNHDLLLGHINTPAVERCDRGLLCEERRGACEYDFGLH